MSGLVTKAHWKNWTADDLKPYIDFVIECFGFDRIMYGSDWPPIIQAATIPVWVQTLDQAISGCSETEKQALFNTNAIGFYNLQKASGPDE